MKLGPPCRAASRLPPICFISLHSRPSETRERGSRLPALKNLGRLRPVAAEAVGKLFKAAADEEEWIRLPHGILRKAVFLLLSRSESR